MIVGCGDIGITLARQLKAQGTSVTGVRRRPEALTEAGIAAVAADVQDAESLAALPDAEVVVYVISADRFEEEAYRAAYPDGLKAVLAEYAGRKRPPKRVFFVSSTSVYAQQAGETVDEHSEVVPHGFSGQLMLEAEQALLAHDLPGTVVRFSGIYGPGRDRLIRQVREGRIAPASPAMYSNRIHRDDCTGVLAHLIDLALADQPLEPLYLASDCEPAPLHEVMQWLADKLRVEPSQVIQSPLRRRASKRCDNALLLESGYRFRYPSFREGYAQVLEAGGFLPTKKG
ncbi:NAD(P)-dependent oxidoreductase [Bisbaumannia pacifica]|uniref:NAD(P)-dependent oxidoreductase n=1 Tax=Bisbaumannia pacifica TaxID=77098 RepID=A0A510X701_9GAMM|nr:NAD(P)-dependent oxidoreductase [Halomonas pacifica]